MRRQKIGDGEQGAGSKQRSHIQKNVPLLPCYVVAIVFNALLMGCSLPTPAVTTDIPSLEVTKAPMRGQLPISAQANIAGQKINLEVARTPQQQATGLMYRTTLADNRGMLFLFEPPQVVGFWMKNVRIPLDMLFIKDGKISAIATDVPPCKTAACPTYGPTTPIDQVIELRGGVAAKLGIKVGQTVQIQYLSPRPK